MANHSIYPFNDLAIEWPHSRVRATECTLVLGIGLKNQNRLIGNSKRSIIDYNRFSACFVRKTEYSFLTKYN